MPKLDSFTISINSEILSEFMKDKCKQLIEEAEAKEANEILNKFAELISDYKLVNKAEPLSKPKPFIVVDGQVYISDAHIQEAGLPFKVQRATTSRIEGNNNSWSIDSNGALKVFDKNNILRVRIALK